MNIPFVNEPFTPFAVQANQEAFEDALRQVEAELGQEYPIIIGGKKITSSRTLTSVNPAAKNQVVGTIHQADQELAEKAIQTAAQTFHTWKHTDPNERARYLYKAAAIMRRRKHEFSAWMVYEAGKTWPEADADTAEAIDFMEYYARDMQRLSEPQPLVRIAGEDNELSYIPLGVGVVIPPWNFPLAIMAGMTSAALVSGNTVVLKPASTTPVIAAKFMELLAEVGLPDGVVNFLPGPGSEVGDYLVDHALTRFISFTGSRDVGLRINERAARTAPGQKWIKRVIAEMGGKDSIVVDSDSDLELAAESITASAFGFSGQKCSACSRAIIHKDVYDEVLQKVIERTQKLTMGSPLEVGSQVGPVIDDKAYAKITEYIEIGKGEGRLVHGGGTGNVEGYFIEPTIIADVLSPDVVLIPEAKKALSSYTPCGVSMYLPFTARLTVDSCMPIFSAITARLSGFSADGPLTKKCFCSSITAASTRTKVLRRKCTLRMIALASATRVDQIVSGASSLIQRKHASFIDTRGLPAACKL